MALTDLVTGANLGPEFDIGGAVANQITINVDGVTVLRNAVSGQLSAAQGALTFNNATNTLTFTDAAGTAQNIDLSGLANATDIYVTGASLAGTVLTLTDNDAGTADVTVDLASFLGVSADANNALVAGSDGKALLTAQDVFNNFLT